MLNYIYDALTQEDIDLIDIMSMTGNDGAINALADSVLQYQDNTSAFNSTACDIQQAINILNKEPLAV